MIYRLLRIQLEHRLLHGGGKAHRVRGSADREPHEIRGVLRFRPVKLDARTRLERPVTDVPHHADNGHPRCLRSRSAALDAFSDGIFISPIGMRHGFVDDGHWRSRIAVALLEKPPGDERCAHRLEKTRRRDAPVSLRRSILRRHGARFHRCRSRVALAAQGEYRNCSGRSHSRQLLDATHKFVEESSHLFRLCVFRRWETNLHRQHALGTEARIHLQQLDETPQQQPGACQEDDSQRRFRRHEDAAQSVRRAAFHVAAAPLFQDVVANASARLQRRRKSE